MKLQVKKENQESIEGYEVVNLDSSMDISNITPNSCEEIFAPDACDSFSFQGIAGAVEALVSKLRLGGTIVLGGTHVNIFAKTVSLGLIPPQEASNIIAAANSMTIPEVLVEIFGKFNLNVDTVNIDGLHYEVKARRV